MTKKSTAPAPVPDLKARLARVRTAFAQLEADVEALRERRQHLLDERALLSAAPVPLDEARQRVRDFIARKADDARHRMSERCSSPMLPGWDPVAAPHLGDSYEAVLIDEPFGFFALIGFGEAIENVILATMCGGEDDAKGVAAPERAQRLAAIEAELAEIESAEEAIIRAGHDAGVSIGRRADADPAVLLAPDDDAENED